MPSQYAFVQDYRKITEYFEIREDGLFHKKGDKEYLIRYTAIEHIRLRYFPGRLKTNQYEAHLNLKNGMKLRIASVSFEGFGTFSDQAEAYSPFIRELINVVQKNNPKVVLQYGHSMGRFLFGLISQLMIFGLLGWVLFSLPFSGGLIWARLLYILFFLPVLIRYFIRNRPVKETSKTLEQVLP
jgi:hypothetical protein